MREMEPPREPKGSPNPSQNVFFEGSAGIANFGDFLSRFWAGAGGRGQPPPFRLSLRKGYKKLRKEHWMSGPHHALLPLRGAANFWASPLPPAPSLYGCLVCHFLESGNTSRGFLDAMGLPGSVQGGFRKASGGFLEAPVTSWRPPGGSWEPK